MDLNLTQTVHMRSLERAAELLGGNDALAAYLKVTPVKLGMWLRGGLVPPGDVFLRVVDLLLEHDVTTLRQQNIHGGYDDGDQANQT